MLHFRVNQQSYKVQKVSEHVDILFSTSSAVTQQVNVTFSYFNTYVFSQ